VQDARHRVPFRGQDADPSGLQVRQVEEDDVRQGRLDFREQQPREAALHEAQRLRGHQLLQDGGMILVDTRYYLRNRETEENPSVGEVR